MRMTEAQFKAMMDKREQEALMVRSKPVAPATEDGKHEQDAVDDEGPLQRETEAYLRAKGAFVFHMPGKAAIGNVQGLPDIIAFCPGAWMFLCELKSRKGVVSPEQKKVIAKLNELGFDVRVHRNIEAVIAHYKENNASNAQRSPVQCLVPRDTVHPDPSPEDARAAESGSVLPGAAKRE